MGASLSHFWCLACWVVEFSVRLIQVGNNRNDHFRYFCRCPHPLNRGVHLIKVSFKVNIREINLGTWLNCPLNRGCLLNTGFTVHPCACVCAELQESSLPRLLWSFVKEFAASSYRKSSAQLCMLTQDKSTKL